jgi:serine/threonine protein kinase/Tfp pilus assembly protein PilF
LFVFFRGYFFLSESVIIPSLSMLEANQQFGRYRICSALGAGGMGEVYLAEDVALERLVALKVLPAAIARDKERMRRFVQEAKTASALNHPNILTIYEIGEADGLRFIVSEYVEGKTLRERLSDERLPLPETLEIAVQIAAALERAHASGIVHRDIKPENVMIRADDYVKVLDFGLAKLTENKSALLDPEGETLAQVNTAAGMILGTVAYMSPEQARGQKVDTRSDIFSFGVCLYEMLAGFNPFKGETTVDVLAAVLQREPQSLSELKPEIPEELSRIVAKALRKNRHERYQSSKNLWRDLKQLQQLALGTAVNLSQSLIAPGKEAINSLAILPLACAGGDDAQTEYLSDGITESIINALAQISDLNVAPRNTVFRFKGSQSDAQTIGKQLNVRAVLTGRVRQFGKKLIIGVELIDVEKDTQIWGEQYRRALIDIFDLQEEIAEDISEKLRLKLTGEEKKLLAKRYTENAEAYQCYLKGRYFVTTKRTEEWIKKGIEYFQQAIEIDPTYALAFSGLADAYGFLASSTGGLLPHDAYPKAKAAAERALAIDETLGEAHAALGFFHLLYDWNFPAAERQFKRAIELSPNYPNAHDGYGFYLKAMGRHREAIAECEQMQKLDPLSPFAHVSLGWAHYFARDYDRAIKECQNALEMEQNSTFAYRILGFAYLQKGNVGKALAALKKAVRFSSGGLAFEAHLGYVYAVAGKEKEALKLMSDFEKIARRRYVSSYYFAVIYLGLGETDKAFEWLEKAFDERSGFMPFLNVEPMLDSIRADARFTDLRRRMGLATNETTLPDFAGEARTAILSPAANK